MFQVLGVVQLIAFPQLFSSASYSLPGIMKSHPTYVQLSVKLKTQREIPMLSFWNFFLHCPILFSIILCFLASSASINTYFCKIAVLGLFSALFQVEIWGNHYSNPFGFPCFITQTCTAFCPMSKNSCLIYLVQFSSYL